LKLLDAAIVADDHYGDAYARRAYLLEFYAEHYVNALAEVNTHRSLGLQSAKTALRLAPHLSLAHWALAQYLAGVLDVGGADVEYRRAMRLAPGDAGPLSDYSLLVLRMGDTSEALAMADRALVLDPLDPDAYRRRFLVLYYRRDLDKALAFTREVEANSPELFIWPVDFALALILINRLDDAQRYLERGAPDYYQRIVGECIILIRKRRQRELQSKFAAFQRSAGDTDNYQYAQIYAQLGDRDRAFAALDRAWSIRDSGLLWLKVDPLLDPIRDDRRFVSLLRRLTLPS